MGIIGTLSFTENSWTRFSYEDGNIIATHVGVSGHCDGRDEVIGTAANFGDACKQISQQHSPYGKNPNFTYEFSGKAWMSNL